jgi:two-component system sensor histidine kinase YesM
MKRVGDGQLTIVKAIPLKSITQSAQTTIKAGILTGGLFTAASILLSILVSLRISRPIVSLAKTMRMAQVQNFEKKLVQSHDEIGLLEHGYNSLMQRIKEMIEFEYQQEIEVKNAQLMALQAQINPHFLNNTLNLIGGMALSKNAPEIYQITRVIGDLLRYSISTVGDMVSLEDEMKHMRNYIFIQEHRFIGRCSVNIITDDSTQECRLPKFTLQPVIENAFEHGLQRKEGAWQLEVRVKHIGQRVILMVKDAGVGLSEARLKLLRDELQGTYPIKETMPESVEPKRRKGIGLKNVDSRLKLQFGSKYGIRIYSKAGVGTVVVIVLPISNIGGREDA